MQAQAKNQRDEMEDNARKAIEDARDLLEGAHTSIPISVSVSVSFYVPVSVPNSASISSAPVPVFVSVCVYDCLPITTSSGRPLCNTPGGHHDSSREKLRECAFLCEQVFRVHTEPSVTAQLRV